jgi:hypothetical protein
VVAAALNNDGTPLSLAHGNDPNNYGQRFAALFNNDNDTPDISLQEWRSPDYEYLDPNRNWVHSISVRLFEEGEVSEGEDPLVSLGRGRLFNADGVTGDSTPMSL